MSDIKCDECEKIIVSKAYCFWCHNNIDAHAVLDYERIIKDLKEENAILKRMNIAAATHNIVELQKIVYELQEKKKASGASSS